MATPIGPILSQVPGFGRPGKVRFERLPQVERIEVSGDQTTFYWIAGIKIVMRRYPHSGRSNGFSMGRIYYLTITRGESILAQFQNQSVKIPPAVGSVEAAIFARVVAAYNS